MHRGIAENIQITHYAPGSRAVYGGLQPVPVHRGCAGHKPVHRRCCSHNDIFHAGCPCKHFPGIIDDARANADNCITAVVKMHQCRTHRVLGRPNRRHRKHIFCIRIARCFQHGADDLSGCGKRIMTGEQKRLLRSDLTKKSRETVHCTFFYNHLCHSGRMDFAAGAGEISERNQVLQCHIFYIVNCHALFSSLLSKNSFQAVFSPVLYHIGRQIQAALITF